MFVIGLAFVVKFRQIQYRAIFALFSMWPCTRGGKSTAVLQEIPCDTPAEMISEIWKWVHAAAGENSSPHQRPKKRGSWILKNLRPSTTVNETSNVQQFKLYRSQSVDSTLLKK